MRTALSRRELLAACGALATAGGCTTEQGPTDRETTQPADTETTAGPTETPPPTAADTTVATEGSTEPRETTADTTGTTNQPTETQAPAAVFELEAHTLDGWIGVGPSSIQGTANPTLSLQPGAVYVIEWENADGHPHNVVVEDGDENALLRSDIMKTQGALQRVSFTATTEMAAYYCEVHPSNMRGKLKLESSG